MMFAELAGIAGPFDNPKPSDGYAFIVQTFKQPVYSVIYVLWLIALWFHLTHGFWSAMQTLGVSGKIWFNRWKMIGYVFSTIIILMFLAVVVKFSIFAA
jgi:succinate dehydrogenase / fumarate reductase cytochrome b subunit